VYAYAYHLSWLSLGELAVRHGDHGHLAVDVERVVREHVEGAAMPGIVKITAKAFIRNARGWSALGGRMY
jgi:hypothetical protein